MLHCACVDLFADVPTVLRNPYFYPFVVFGVLDFVTTQYALKRARAVTVVALLSIVLHAGADRGDDGVAEALTVLQWFGLAWLLAGVCWYRVTSGARACPPSQPDIRSQLEENHGVFHGQWRWSPAPKWHGPARGAEPGARWREGGGSTSTSGASTKPAEACRRSNRFVCDVTSTETIAEIVHRVETDIGAFDRVMNAAGVMPVGELLDRTARK